MPASDVFEPESLYLVTLAVPARVVLNAKPYRVRALRCWHDPKISSDALVGLAYNRVEFEDRPGKWFSFVELGMTAADVATILVNIHNVASIAKGA